jgi:hypothetical protein
MENIERLKRKVEFDALKNAIKARHKEAANGEGETEEEGSQGEVQT